MSPSDHARYALNLADRLDERPAASLGRDSLRMDIIRTMTADQFAALQEQWRTAQLAGRAYVPIDDLLDQLVVKQ